MVTIRNQLYPSQGVVPSQDTRVAVADRVAKQGQEQKHQGGGEDGKVKTDYTLTKGEKKKVRQLLGNRYIPCSCEMVLFLNLQQHFHSSVPVLLAP